jgi:hypothetical protein
MERRSRFSIVSIVSIAESIATQQLLMSEIGVHGNPPLDPFPQHS